MRSEENSGHAIKTQLACGGNGCCIALPLVNNLLSAHFGHCEEFAVVNIENGKLGELRRFRPPEHAPGVYPEWLSGYGVTDVIAGGIGQKAISLFNSYGINVFAGAPQISLEELINDFLSGSLNLTANYCDHGSGGHTGCKGR